MAGDCNCSILACPLFFCFILSLESRLDEKTMGLLWKASFLHRNGHRTMVVAPKYKHYDGIRYCGETRVRIKDQEDRSADQQIEVDLSSLLTVQQCSTATAVSLPWLETNRNELPGKCQVLASSKGLWRGIARSAYQQQIRARMLLALVIFG